MKPARDLAAIGLVALLLGAATCGTAWAQEESPAEATPTEGPAEEAPGAEGPSDTALTLAADIAYGHNPTAVSAYFGVDYELTYNRDPESMLWDGLSIQGGLVLGPNPAWTQLSFYAQWTPIAVFQLKIQYDLYLFYGENHALFSFPDEEAAFGRRQREALEDLDAEESGVGQRLLVQPTFRFKAGPVIVRNQSDLAFYFLPGDGPFLLELEYDTLVREDFDWIIANRTQLLFAAWEDEAGGTFLVGPQYEVVHGYESEVTRQRVGLLAYLVPTGALGFMDRPRIYMWAGLTFQDRNRDDEGFVVVGVGFDIDA